MFSLRNLSHVPSPFLRPTLRQFSMHLSFFASILADFIHQVIYLHSPFSLSRPKPRCLFSIFFH